jgi:hypothetical protein
MPHGYRRSGQPFGCVRDEYFRRGAGKAQGDQSFTVPSSISDSGVDNSSSNSEVRLADLNPETFFFHEQFLHRITR